MKKTILLTALSFYSLLNYAQAPEGKAKPGDFYGAKVTNTNAIDIKEVPALLASKDTVKVKIKAKVVNSCANKGCWMNLKLDDNSTAFVKMKDYGFFVPLAIADKTVVLEGIAFTKVTSVEELKHYAEDGKKSQAEIDLIKEPKKEIRFLADGILVVQ